MPQEYIFVYGTLRKNAAHAMHAVLAEHCEYFTEGYVQGRLYEVNGYPGVVQSAKQQDRVQGELYRIIESDIVLAELDHYEECTALFPDPHEYTRTKLPVLLQEGSAVSAWVYIFNHDTTLLTQIRSGDYLHFLENGNGEEVF